MKHFSVTAILVLLLSVVAVSPAKGQLLQGSITGNVTDSSQAAITGARVVATDQQTNATRETLTNTAGGYNFPTMPLVSTILRAAKKVPFCDACSERVHQLSTSSRAIRSASAH